MENKQIKANERARRMKDLAFGECGLFEILEKAEERLFESFVNTPLDSRDLREDIYHRLNALRGVRETMEQAINRGASAETTVKRLAKIAQQTKIV